MGGAPHCLHNPVFQFVTRMRLRVVHTLSLLLLSAVLLAVLAMAAVTAWNLRNGFADYLAARDIERLEQFADLVAQAAEQAGGASALQQQRLSMRVLLDRFAQRQGLVPRRSAPAGELRIAGQGGPVPPGPPPGPPPGGADGFGARVVVVSVDGHPLLGRPLPPDGSPSIDRPIRLNGEVIAQARLPLRPQVPDAVDARFLRQQYVGIAAVATALVLLALASAWWVARRWVRPLVAMQDATARIARGELDVRLAGPQQGEGRADEIGDLVRNVNTMAEGLQRLEGVRRRWVADISHELRTPLAVLRGEIEALVDGVRPLQHEAVLSLREETLRIGALVDDLHLLAMSDLKALPCQFDELDAVPFVQQIVARFDSRAASLGLALTADTGFAVAQPVCWDRVRIEQLLVNLIENSLRYTDVPGRIVLAVKRTGPRIVIDIDDSAPGVPAADLPRLFEPLYRADAARSRHRGGSGLGLAICDAIARSHGGGIEAGLSPLGGLRVRIELPVDAGAAA
jgi:two-component system, OmpR family, sensor histidine kinase BaeS